MRNIRVRRMPRNGSMLPLFEWAEAQRQFCLSRGARWLKRKCPCLSIAHAIALANAHGLGGRE